MGEHVIINVGCTVSHEARLGDYCTLAPGVHIAGNTRLGDGCDLGIGTVTIQGIAWANGPSLAPAACSSRTCRPTSPSWGSRPGSSRAVRMDGMSDKPAILGGSPIFAEQAAL